MPYSNTHIYIYRYVYILIYVDMYRNREIDRCKYHLDGWFYVVIMIYLGVCLPLQLATARKHTQYFALSFVD